MCLQLVESQALSTQAQPDVFNLQLRHAQHAPWYTTVHKHIQPCTGVTLHKHKSTSTAFITQVDVLVGDDDKLVQRAARAEHLGARARRSFHMVI